MITIWLAGPGVTVMVPNSLGPGELLGEVTFGHDKFSLSSVSTAFDLQFPDESFDIAYSLSSIEHFGGLEGASAALDEMARVVKPGGEIILSNHIGADSGPVAFFEGWLGKRSASLGWRPQFPWSIVTDWLARRPDIELVERKPLDVIGLFTLIRMKRKAEPAS